MPQYSTESTFVYDVGTAIRRVSTSKEVLRNKQVIEDDRKRKETVFLNEYLT
jgi:hypothetical protein